MTDEMVSVPRRILEDKRLSMDERGLIVTLAMLGAQREKIYTRDVIYMTGYSSNAIYKYFHRLTEYGYVTRHGYSYTLNF